VPKPIAKPSLFIIAGPNGAGKTTFARELLPDFVGCREFVNADLIASGLSPFSPESAELTRLRSSQQRILVNCAFTMSRSLLEYPRLWALDENAEEQNELALAGRKGRARPPTRRRKAHRGTPTIRPANGHWP
jgi:ABC-type glutathione transport system ATPase component